MNKKVTANEVMEAIQDNGSLTISELMDIFSVSDSTIKSRLRELRESGESLFHDSNGLFIMDHISTAEEKESFDKYLKWMIGAFKGLARCGKPTKPLLLESKKYLREQLTKNERKMLSQYTGQINRIVDMIAFEEELEDG
jgi:homoaconitase/3-isopropylmalate dehydratase large subunit